MPYQDLPDSLDDLLLPLSQDTAADMFVLGTQESTSSRYIQCIIWARNSFNLHALKYVCTIVGHTCTDLKLNNKNVWTALVDCINCVLYLKSSVALHVPYSIRMPRHILLVSIPSILWCGSLPNMHCPLHWASIEVDKIVSKLTESILLCICACTDVHVLWFFGCMSTIGESGKCWFSRHWGRLTCLSSRPPWGSSTSSCSCAGISSGSAQVLLQESIAYYM